MSRKKHKHRRSTKTAGKASEKTNSGAASRHGRHNRPHGKHRKYPPITATATVAAAVVAVVGAAVFTYEAWQSQPAPLSFELDDRRVAQKWSIQGQGETTPHGIRLEPAQGKDGNASLMSPELKSPDGAAPHWRSFPYVRVEITPEDHERVMYLFWIPGKDPKQNLNRPFTAPASADEVLVDARQKIAWKGIPGWDDPGFGDPPIGRIAVLAQDAVEIRRIDLLPTLNPLQLARLVWAQYWTHEPVRTNSINAHFGNEILGTPLTVLFGGVLTVLFALIWVTRRNRYRTALLWGMVACFVLTTAPFNVTLWKHAEASGKISAWHADRWDEYRSRFGEEFANLDKGFLKHVPKGSRVSFPASKRRPTPGETNWIWFLYYGLYENYRDRRNDISQIDEQDEYVFYYHPKKVIHDEEQNLLRYVNKKGTGTHKTQTLARVSQNAKILKLIRD